MVEYSPEVAYESKTVKRRGLKDQDFSTERIFDTYVNVGNTVCNIQRRNYSW